MGEAVFGSRASYDWMAAELVAMADAVAGDSAGTEASRMFLRQMFLSVAEFVSKTHGSGVSATDLAREFGVSRATVYNAKARAATGEAADV